MTAVTATQEAKAQINLGTRLAALSIIVFTAPLLVMIAVRLIMTPLFLDVEYYRPGFPADPYGFTTSERVTHGREAVAYLLNGDDIAFLGDLNFPDGAALFNARELHHMRDVKAVTQYAYLAAVVVGMGYLAALYTLYRTNRERLANALMRGAIATLVIIVAIVVLAAVGWEFFFVAFHQLFFTDGTWYFPYSDALIRLFPEQFWFDAALTIGGLTIFGAGLIYMVSRRLSAQR